MASTLTDAVFAAATAIVTVVAYVIEFRKKEARGARTSWVPLREQLESAFFWLYFLYLDAIFVAIIRTAVLSTGAVRAEVFTCYFCWSGSLVVLVGTVFPYRLLQIRKRPLAPVQTKNLVFISRVSISWCFFGIVSIVLGVSGIVSAEMLLLSWRIVFFVCVFVELVLLSWCFYFFITAKVSASTTAALRNFLIATAYMRIGIVVAILLKLGEVLDLFYLKLVHMFIVATGISFYSARFMRAVRGTCTCTRKKYDPGSESEVECKSKSKSKSKSKNSTTSSASTKEMMTTI